jgi:putative acetyltransferase
MHAWFMTCDIRAYRGPDDATATFDVFQAAICQTASSVYGPGQVEAWAGPARTDLSDWDRLRREASTLVAEVDDTVVGFTDLLLDGLVDMLFVHPRSGAGVLHAPC